MITREATVMRQIIMASLIAALQRHRTVQPRKLFCVSSLCWLSVADLGSLQRRDTALAASVFNLVLDSILWLDILCRVSAPRRYG